MSRRSNVIPVFIFFLILSFFSYALFKTGIGNTLAGVVELAVRPVKGGIFSAYVSSRGEPTRLQQLEEENRELRTQLAKVKEQEKEIKALRDQFALTSPSSRSLTPAKIVGLKAFIPGFTLPEQIIIDKGTADGVKKNSVVIYKDNLLGIVSTSREHLAVVDLTFKNGFSITATTLETNALGVATGKGDGEVMIDNVVLSDTLKKGDFVVTKGSTNVDSTGAPPGLIVGRINSVDKKPSALFQTAKIERLVDITRLTTVFVITENSQ